MAFKRRVGEFLSRLLVGLAVFALSGGGSAQTEQDSGLAQAAWFRQFQRDLRRAWVPPRIAVSGKVRFVIGNDIVQPGKQFTSGKQWQALVCADGGCRLEKAELSVIELQQSGKQGPVQRLRLSGARKIAGRAIAWFDATRAPLWLTPGEVATYYDGLDRPKETGHGSEEAKMTLSNGSEAALVPVLVREPSAEEKRPPVLLQLRADGKRQLLLGQLGLCTFSFNSAGYLIWAGDLDHDGKPDYLISFVDGEGPVHLYLSSEARPDQLVGLGGVYNTPPAQAECGDSSEVNEPD